MKDFLKFMFYFLWTNLFAKHNKELIPEAVMKIYVDEKLA